MPVLATGLPGGSIVHEVHEEVRAYCLAVGNPRLCGRIIVDPPSRSTRFSLEAILNEPDNRAARWVYLQCAGIHLAFATSEEGEVVCEP